MISISCCGKTIINIYSCDNALLSVLCFCKLVRIVRILTAEYYKLLQLV